MKKYILAIITCAFLGSCADQNIPNFKIGYTDKDMSYKVGYDKKDGAIVEVEPREIKPTK